MNHERLMRGLTVQHLLFTVRPLESIVFGDQAGSALRGALYQAMGDRSRAIEFYEKFISAWERADTALQSLVDRAREAVASLKGDARPVTPPPPS